jgi:hypothetical protein
VAVAQGHRALEAVVAVEDHQAVTERQLPVCTIQAVMVAAPVVVVGQAALNLWTRLYHFLPTVAPALQAQSE